MGAYVGAWDEEKMITNGVARKLTVKELQALQLSDDGRKLREPGGMIGVVRARADGIKVKFVWRYRYDGRALEFYLGTWPDTDLAAIRRTRDTAKLKRSQGLDPMLERRTERENVRLEEARRAAQIEAERLRLEEEQARSHAELTVAALFERWEGAVLSKTRRGTETARALRRDVLPAIGALKAREVRRGHIVAIIDGVLERGAMRMADRVRNEVGTMFRWALTRELIDADPTAGLTRNRLNITRTERERVLSRAEILELARGLAGVYTPSYLPRALWLLLATCVRVGELTRATWSAIDLEQGLWRIPPEDAKNGREHLVHLSAFALAQLRGLPRVDGSDWVFRSRRLPGPIGEKVITKAVADRQRDQPLNGRTQHTEALRLSGGRWTPHDLRRTAATFMQELGVRAEVIERCLNHSMPGGVMRIYQRSELLEERRTAFDRLGQLLGELEGRNRQGQ